MIGDVIDPGFNPQTPQPCPSCGHCPTCGRGPTQPIYYWPNWQPYYGHPFSVSSGMAGEVLCKTTSTSGYIQETE